MSTIAESTDQSPPLPCPFCGRAPEQSSKASDWTESGKVFYIFCMCDGHKSNAHISGDTLDEALAKWNTRWEGKRG